MKKIMLFSLFPIAFMCIGFAILSGSTPSVKTDISQKINLALRQTAHRLLAQVGDSTSRIAPIQQTAENTYLVF